MLSELVHNISTEWGREGVRSFLGLLGDEHSNNWRIGSAFDLSPYLVSVARKELEGFKGSLAEDEEVIAYMIIKFEGFCGYSRNYLVKAIEKEGLDLTLLAAHIAGCEECEKTTVALLESISDQVPGLPGQYLRAAVMLAVHRLDQIKAEARAAG